MGQSTSVERGTNCSVRQKPCLKKSVNLKERCVSSTEANSSKKVTDGEDVDHDSTDSGAQVFRSYHVKDRIDSLIEEYLTENTSTRDSDSEDNTQAVSSTEDPAQDPSSSVNDCEQDKSTCVKAAHGSSAKDKNSEVDSTNGSLESNVEKLSNSSDKALPSNSPSKMDGTSSLSLFGGSHGKQHSSHLAKPLSNPQGSGEMNHRKGNPKQIKLQTLIDKVLESSLGNSYDNEKDGSGKCLATVEKDEKEISKLSLSSALLKERQPVRSDRQIDDHRLTPKSISNKAPKVDLGCSKDGLENFKTHIQKAVSARFDRDRPRTNPMHSHEPHASMGHGNQRHHAPVHKPETPVSHNPGRHQDMKGVFNVQQIIERVIKEADLKNEFGDDKKKTVKQPSHNLPYNVHPSQRESVTVHRDRNRDYHSSVSAYGTSTHPKVSEEPKSSPAIYPHSDNHQGQLGTGRDYRYNYGRHRPVHHQPHSSPTSRDLHLSRPKSASYPTEVCADNRTRAESFSHKSYKRHSPPPLVHISDAQASHPHRQSYGNKYSDQCLPPPAKIRKEHYHDHMEANIALNSDMASVYRNAPRMQMTTNVMHGNNIRNPENLPMRPIYPMPVQVGLPFRASLGPLPGPRSTPWIGAAEQAALSMQHMRQTHANQPVHVTPRYPVSKHPNGIMPQRVPSQMLPGVMRESPVSQHSMSHHNPPPQISPSLSSDLKHRQTGSITKGTAPAPPQSESSQSKSSDHEKRSRRTEELPLDLSKKPSSTPSPAPSSNDGGEGSRLPNGEPNCMSTHIKSLEESVEKYFHDYNRSNVPLDRLPVPDGITDPQVYLQHRLMAEAHAQAHVHAQAQAHAHAIAQAQAQAHAQEQAQAQARVHVQSHPQSHPQAHPQTHPQAHPQTHPQVHQQTHHQSQINSQSQNLKMHSPNFREATPSRDISYSSSPRPPRQEAGVSPRQPSPHPLSYPTVIQSPSGANIHNPDPIQKEHTPSPVSSDSSKQSSSKNMKQVSKHEPIQSLLGSHAPSDILYLICRLCGQTYGSPYGFRRHFRNQHGFEPQAHHTQVQTISETRSARHPMALDSNDLSPTLEVQDSPTLKHPPAENSMFERAPVIDRHSPSQDSELPESKAQIVNGISSESRPSSVLSGPDCKSDSSSGSEDKCSRSKPPMLEEGEERRFLSCQECGEKFQLNDFGLYKKHCRAHDKDRQGKFKCTDCRSNFCEAHQDSRPAASIKGPHLCHLCSLFFPNPTALSQHIEMDHKLEEIQQHDPRQQSDKISTMYDCPHCKKQLGDFKSYLDHKQNCSRVTVEGECQNSNISVPSSVDENHLQHGQMSSESANIKECSDNKSENLDENCEDNSLGLLWKKKKSAIKLIQPEGSSNCASVLNGDAKDSAEESGDLYRHKKFSRLPAKRRDSDLESLDSVSSAKRLKLDVPGVDENRRTSSCSSTAASPAGSSVRSACSSPNSATEEPSTKSDFKKHSKFAKGMKYVSGLYGKGGSSPTQDPANSSSKQNKDKTKTEEAATRPKRGDKKERGKKNSDKSDSRHPLPFVWDRVTRSKAGKHGKK